MSIYDVVGPALDKFIEVEIFCADFDRVRIWCNKGGGAWWRPDGKGYTVDIDQAGYFEREQAEKICADTHGENSVISVEPRRFSEDPALVPVLLEECTRDKVAEIRCACGTWRVVIDDYTGEGDTLPLALCLAVKAATQVVWDEADA